MTGTETVNDEFEAWIPPFAVCLAGRRTTGQVARLDLTVLVLCAGTTIAAVPGDDHGMVGAFSGIGTIGLMRIPASWLTTRSDRFGRSIGGTHVGVFEHGVFSRRPNESDFMAAARQRGLMRLIRCDAAGRDGTISIAADQAQ